MLLLLLKKPIIKLLFPKIKADGPAASAMILNMIARPIFPAIFQSPINCGVIAMLGGLIIVPVVSWITPKIDKNSIDEMFSCYNKKVLVNAKKSLGE